MSMTQSTTILCTLVVFGACTGEHLPPAIPEERHLRLMAESLSQRPEPRADKKDRQGNDNPRRRRHQSINADTLAISLAGAAKNRKRRHVGGENGEEEHHLADGAVGEEKIFCVCLAAPEGDAADKGNQAEVKADDNDGNHAE